MSVDNLLDLLNDQQLAAVLNIDKPVRIIAGAGSGKTRVITTKIAYLIEKQNIDPSRILAVTFTNKATKEMKERVLQITNNSFKSPFISTFHSWCSKVLRIDGKHIGLEDKFLIIDSDDQKRIIKSALKESNIELSENDKKTFDKKILYKIKEWKEELVDPSEAILNATSTLEKNFAVIYRLYQNTLLKNNSLDFDDLQIYVYRLFKQNNEILNKWRNAYDYVLVDEFQDTNELQFSLIKFLTINTNHLTVVGDPDQTIYSWRGAKLDIILNFNKTYSNAISIVLNQNYRSTKQILDISNSFIKNNKFREHKEIFTNNKSGKKVVLKECNSKTSEASYVSSKIKELVKQGYHYKDIFILYRMNAWSQEFEKELANKKIPFQLIGGIKFRERKVIKDAMAFLKMISIKDNLSSQRVLGLIPKIGNITIEKIINTANLNHLNIFDLITNEDKTLLHSITKNLDELIEVFKTAHQLYLDNTNIEEILKYLLIQSGYENKLKVKKEQDDLENINALYDQLKRFDEDFDPKYYSEENKLIAFLQEEALTSDIDEAEQIDKVSLLTVHAAKGLENKIVFITGLNQGIFPSRLSETSIDELEEERRALYVALTRAKDELFLTYVKGDHSHIMQSELKPSKFIHELDKDLYEFETQFLNTLLYDSNDYKQSSFYVSPKQHNLYNVGDHVEHKLFGKGVVVRIINDQLQISFTNSSYGIMMIATNNSALTKV
ncbi:AAA family ATPase [Mycoplasma capricolum subsp. capripneumoniae]|uniref:ATP-dependent helicase n=1 Tax=Mycoplasma capricolum TaxID=2095 RepID=UPI0002E4DF64|nr:UvrD-helicase domain-containing protein [Mycoplasma capricolum]AOQ22370.1 AAA family ATPase [Mycoplasma capricolum subsp. capripneumoniae M1601]QIN43987.1 AAA family ATPase [Mycoplasma capricolum subsp. capripneumoniae]QIN44673.1 AAA family ATPase [Mycoplasma capricolum subsp. capripneumoniae]